MASWYIRKIAHCQIELAGEGCTDALERSSEHLETNRLGIIFLGSKAIRVEAQTGFGKRNRVRTSLEGITKTGEHVDNRYRTYSSYSLALGADDPKDTGTGLYDK